MKKLLILLFICGSHLVSFGQKEIDGIPAKVKREYVLFNFTKFDEEIANLSKFKKSLTSLESWYKKKQDLKGNLGARISEKLNRDKEEELVMTQYAVVIINFDKEITHSILQGEGADYQNKYNKLVEKTQKGKVTPELGQIINANLKNVSNKYTLLKEFNVSYRNKLRNKQTSADFNSLFNNSKAFNYVKEYISTEVVEEDNPVYIEAQRKKKEKEVLTSLPHLKYSGKFDDGYAEYSYKETPEGERVYDGRYFYKETLGGNDYIITSEGQYKNDIRIGRWVWTYKYRGKIASVQIFNFDENGYLHGEISSSDYDSKVLNYKIHFNHGHIIGKYTNIWDDRDRGFLNINFNNDGKVIGTATYKKQDPPYMYYETFEDGECVSSHTTNYQTGDKIQRGIDIKNCFIGVVVRNVLKPQATWLKERNMSPQRKGPQIAIYKKY